MSARWPAADNRRRGHSRRGRPGRGPKRKATGPADLRPTRHRPAAAPRRQDPRPEVRHAIASPVGHAARRSPVADAKLHERPPRPPSIRPIPPSDLPAATRQPPGRAAIAARCGSVIRPHRAAPLPATPNQGRCAQRPAPVAGSPPAANRKGPRSIPPDPRTVRRGPPTTGPHPAQLDRLLEPDERIVELPFFCSVRPRCAWDLARLGSSRIASR